MPLFDPFQNGYYSGSLVAWRVAGRPGHKAGFLRKMLSRSRGNTGWRQGRLPQAVLDMARVGGGLPGPIYLPLLSPGSQRTTEGGRACKFSGEHLQPYGDLFAEWLSNLTANQRDAAGKEEFKLAMFDSYLLMTGHK